MGNRFYKLIEAIIRLLNRTILKSYNSWQWDNKTHPQGKIITYEDWESDKEWDFEEYKND